MTKDIVHRFGNILAVKIFDRMIDRRTRQISRVLQQSIAELGRVRLLFAVESHPQVNSPEALFESLQFARLHADHIDRIAIVGNKAWERTCVGLFGLFGGIEMEYFDQSEIQKAVNWLRMP